MAKNKKQQQPRESSLPADNPRGGDADDYCETVAGQVQLFPAVHLIPLEKPEPIPTRRTKRTRNDRDSER